MSKFYIEERLSVAGRADGRNTFLRLAFQRESIDKHIKKASKRKPHFLQRCITLSLTRSIYDVFIKSAVV